jgi:IS5 family transposase
MLVLQQLFNISDEELEFQVNDRRSFEEFVRLGVMNRILDATTFAFFKEWQMTIRLSVCFNLVDP